MTHEFWWNAFSWFIRSLFWVGLLPQIILNYKYRTTKGISDLMLLGYLTGYISATYYVICLNLPIQYRVMVPLSLATVFIMVLQRLFYDRSVKALLLYSGSMLLAFLAIPLAFKYTNFAGHFFGWIAVVIWTIYQIPQIVKIYFQKSIIGFSFFLVTAVGLGNIIECIFAYFAGFPDQSIVSGLRGGLIYAIFVVQFALYRRNGKSVSRKR